ncbi:cupin domain-containing protein [Granulicella sp. dw_53]|uniref:cupin domain-containing protein n=1 Tax=Granulicella sp. dw_53 TaxID=2719792 RepID=UPI001BD6A8C7|nr:cupin domain-containing protein [Granulicella sp. dw_53]
MTHLDRRQFATGMVAAAIGGCSVSVSSPTPEQLHLKPNGWVPNNTLPVLIYRSAVPATSHDPASEMERLFTAHQWPPQWRNGIYTFHHFHSTAHEVLGIAAGQVNVVLGGEGGSSVVAKAGDILVLPAGTGHCRISASDDLLVIGAYPEDEHWDICRTALTPEALERMKHVRYPASDPVTGPGGPLPTLWKSA